MAAITTILAAAAVATTAAAATDQRNQARRARRQARRDEGDVVREQAAAEQELEQNKQRDEVSRAMFDQRRRQRAMASFSTGRRSTNTTGLGLSGGFGAPTKMSMGA